MANPDRRIAELDGLRGFMTIAVVVSHFFGEVQHGVPALMFGWIAVTMFYVLSGFLIARLILNKGHHDNFFQVFYIRRICRTFPIYLVCVFLIFWLNSNFHPETTLHGENIPLWAYLTFTQNFWIAQTGSMGTHWLAPTWTLALEEQFYLVAPALLLFVPRRWLVRVLTALLLLGPIARAYVLFASDLHPLAANVLLPTNSDVLIAGILAAVLLANPSIDWSRYSFALRVAPLIALVVVAIVSSFAHSDLATVLRPLLISLGCACHLMSVVQGAQEGKRYQSEILQFFCRTSYATYLTHLMVLGVLHNVVLGTPPDIETAQQIAVTVLAIPATIGLAWLLTTFVENPITDYGRSFKWGSAPTRLSGTKYPTRNDQSAFATGLARHVDDAPKGQLPSTV